MIQLYIGTKIEEDEYTAQLQATEAVKVNILRPGPRLN